MQPIIILLGLCLISCGKSGSTSATETPTTVETPAPVVAKPTPLMLIAGQSNAAGLLASFEGRERSSVEDRETPNSSNVVGYAVGGTSITFWLKPENLAKVSSLVHTYCSTSLVFIWAQGESDTYTYDSGDYIGDYTQYPYRVSSFLNTLHNVCPEMTIKLLRIKEIPLNPASQVNQIRSFQENAGYPIYNMDLYPSPDGTHLTVQGYQQLFQAMIK